MVGKGTESHVKHFVAWQQLVHSLGFDFTICKDLFGLTDAVAWVVLSLLIII